MKPTFIIVSIAWALVLQAQAQCLSGDCANGRGHMRYPDGSEYIGHFKDGMAHGSGECTYADNPSYPYKRYKGHWENNRFHGYGEATDRLGKITAGHWNNNTFVGDTPITPTADLSQSPAVNPRRKYALVIGISQYLHFNSLKLADNDAYLFESFLRSVPGGALRDHEIILLIDTQASHQKIREALQQLAQKATQPDDMLLVYYSGHGLPSGWVPYDSYGEAQDIITFDEIDRRLAQSPAQYKLYLADACYSGSAPRGRHESSQITMITSSKADETSSEDLKLSNGVFTHYLLKGLEEGLADFNHDSIVTDQELIRYLNEVVPSSTKGQQTPQFHLPPGRTEQLILSTLN